MSTASPDDISKRVYAAGQEIDLRDDAFTGNFANEVLASFMGKDFQAGSGFVVDQGGAKTQHFASVIRRANKDEEESPSTGISADTVAAVIDYTDLLTLELFREAYNRIAEAKRLKKTSVANNGNQTNITLGIIFAKRSSVTLEKLGEELYRLNTERSHSEWTDMIVISSVGIVNYAIQFPGELLSGDFLPPAEGAFKRSVPAFYVVIVARPTLKFSFNKMLAFLLAHLKIFSPNASLPKWGDILEGVPSIVVTLLGFQANLSGQFVPVPREQYRDRLLPQTPTIIDDGHGHIRSEISYMPWQDGGIIMLAGKLPLEGLLLFLKDVSPQHFGVIKRPNLQISYVLPISQRQYYEFLNTVRRQSNFTVDTEPNGFVIQKLADEGTTTPFIARCSLGILRIRDGVYTTAVSREQFDKAFEHVITSLSNTRESAKQLSKIWQTHLGDVVSGKAATINGRNIRIECSIDKPLAAEVEKFLNSATRTLKTGMQSVAQELGVEIGFLFKKQSAFEVAIGKLYQSDPDLAQYLRASRNWTELLIKARNDLEHSLWSLPRISYSVKDNAIALDEPQILDMGISQFASYYFDRVACFFEEFIIHALQKRLPVGISVTEIPLAQRLVEAPERFQITLATGGRPAWHISPHNHRFDDV